MKNFIKNIGLFTLVVLLLSAYNTLDIETKDIDVKNSKVVWKGYKVTGSHEGTIAIQSGSLEFTDQVLTGGKVIIDMTSIDCTDLTDENKGKLEGHLKSDDFFGVEKYNTASLVFTEVKPKGKNAYSVIGDLTIKSTTQPVTFEISVYGNKATTNLKIDRTQYDVKYGSASFFDGLKDKAIYDEFDLVADLEF
ncbi:YceI family protein [Aquimarina sp. ERC-38]|uniref:YceI family protein n=1 Tax=Aquimarina sp. ERC-38 TaxID=2949996 RepID=UPI0022467DF5|nr:YceI family protein [Aquimarina sp. ERC-38]UZO82529.1 YceI family protein [Aquimarina sp. ERC-38]